MKTTFIFFITSICLISCQQNSNVIPTFPQNPDAYFGEWKATSFERDTGTGWFTYSSGIAMDLTNLDLRINAGSFEGIKYNNSSTGNVGWRYYLTDLLPNTSYHFNSSNVVFSVSYLDTISVPSILREYKSTVEQFNVNATPNFSTMRLIHTIELNGVEDTTYSFRNRISYERSF